MLAVTPTTLRERDERSLVEWHRSGRPEAFEEIVRRYTPALLSAARRRLLDRQAAEDAVQETFARAYRAIDRFDGEYRLGGWLHQILLNVCLDECQRRQRQDRLIDRLETAVDAAGVSTIEPVVEATDDGHEVTEALSQLPAPYREALVMRFVEERPYDEVAAAAGISEQNARARTSRARRMMRHALSGAAAFVGALAGLVRKGERAAVAMTPDALVTSPAVVQLGPTFTHLSSAGNAIAASVGVAASAAIAFVALTPETEKPPPAPVAEEAQDSASVSAPGDPVVASASVAESAPTTEAAPATTDTSAPATSDPATTTTAAAPVPQVQPTPIAPVGNGTTLPPPPPPARAAGSTLEGSDLQVTDAGARSAITGSLVIRTADGDQVASIDGKLLLPEGEAGQAEGEIVLRLADGRTATLKLVGDSDGDGTFSGRYLLEGGDRIGVAPEGDLTGSFHEVDGTGSLTLVLNGGHAADDAAG